MNACQPRMAAVVAVLLASVVPGCAARSSVVNVAASKPNFRLVVWNSARPAELEVAVDSIVIFSKRVEASEWNPAIVGGSSAGLRKGLHRISVLDHSTGQVTTREFQMNHHINAHVSVESDGLAIRTTDNPDEFYD